MGRLNTGKRRRFCESDYECTSARRCAGVCERGRQLVPVWAARQAALRKTHRLRGRRGRRWLLRTRAMRAANGERIGNDDATKNGSNRAAVRRHGPAQLRQLLRARRREQAGHAPSCVARAGSDHVDYCRPSEAASARARLPRWPLMGQGGTRLRASRFALPEGKNGQQHTHRHLLPLSLT